MSDGLIDADDLPPDLAARASLRKGSVFADLITVFRRNTPKKTKKYHARRPSNKDYSLEVIDESEAFLGTDASSAGVQGHDDDDEEGKPMTRQILLNKIRQKKEVIGKLRCQPWSMSRKRRTLRLAQKYLEQHESRVSKTHLFKEDVKKRWHGLCRWADNIKIYLIPWEAKIKTIESHFGSVVSSYFTFLRWVIFVNLVISLIVVSFVVIPEVLADAAADEGRRNRSETRKRIPESVREVADSFTVVWDYNVSRMAANARLSKMAGSKAEQYVFNWKVFTGWDYTIGNPDAASNTVMAIIIKLRESIAECRVAKAKDFRWLLFLARFFANVVIILMLAFSIYCISFAVQSSTTVEITGTKFNKNQVPAIVSTITHVFPMIFDLIGRMEKYHPRNALRAHLTRVLVLYMLNYMTLIISLFDKIKEIQGGDDLDTLERNTRQLGGRNPNLLRPPPFASRNFSNRSQAQNFLNKSISRFTPLNSSSVTPFPKTTRNFRQTNDVKGRKEGPLTVESQHGPAYITKPSAVIQNKSKTDERNPYGPVRLGPSPAPTIYSSKAQKILSPHTKGWNFTNFLLDKSTSTLKEITPTDSSTNTARYRLVLDKTGQPVVKPIDNASATDEEGAITLSLENSTALYLNNSRFEGSKRGSRNRTESAIVCWETMIGQELVKLVTMDLIITIASILIIDFFRGLWIRYCSSWWCWDVETTFPEYGEFKVAENVLHIINNQGMVWLGLFFAPMLPVMNNVKMIVLMYIRGWACMTCNVPAREIFRASRSSNFYLWILLLWLLLCTVPVFWVFASKMPSVDCGPFANQKHYYNIVTDMLEKHKTTKDIFVILKNVASPGIVIPTLLLLLLIIYFLVSLVRGLREANNDLQQQLFHERTEEKKKIFELAGGATKKNSEHMQYDKKKKVVSYLPVVEQKRREPWRAYTGHDNDSVCVSDQTSDEATHTARTQSPSLPSRAKPFMLSSFSKDSSFDVESATKRGGKPMEKQSSKATAVSQSAVTEKIEDWSNYELKSDQSFDVASDVVQLASPEEIKSLMPPSISNRKGSGISFGISPRDSDAGGFKFVFPTTLGTNSRRSSKQQSTLNLAECGVLKDSCKLLNYGNVAIISVPGQEESDQNFLSRGDLVEGSESKSEHISRRDEDKAAAKRANLQRQNCIRRHDVPSTSAEFRSWPSPTEAKLQKEKTTSPSTSPIESAAKPHSEKQLKGFEEQKSGTSAVGTQQRRFRISVSPTHRYKKPEPSGSDTDTSTGKRRYMIKQEVMLDSVNSASTQNSSQFEQVPSPRAPCVEFGEDDSPKIHETRKADR